jgi:hypothetical protein
MQETGLAAEDRADTPAHKPGDTHLGNRMQNLTAVLERLWLFYDAMRAGKPVQNAGQVLAEVGTALRKTRKPVA